MHPYSYNIIFRIRHPSIDPDKLTKRFRMKPHRFWKVGEFRRFPHGDVLKTRNKDSFWSCSEDYVGKVRTFFGKVDRLANRLKRHKAFLHQISAASGKSEIYIQLHGDENIGDTLSPKTLALLAELNIFLSVEVFPSGQFRVHSRDTR
jgi:hypothetical protein